ncbi:hypothetical protein FA09DRAFT_257942 [Tilletiopsis washingtonensis]|uniref:Uncharacterized protein n=1 Tax=Tilletiopsis washingtonensis TaxID=58919 RepID=A0A316ZD67_9BASI|nr:hypothetical protein FA09DRAFT_257942 [Tilletiopsis washingtonensis]PWN98882.1 hypothetical protein FA09DRAFT_257942 [Tilletiopsis washingtonensis]
MSSWPARSSSSGSSRARGGRKSNTGDVDSYRPGGPGPSANGWPAASGSGSRDERSPRGAPMPKDNGWGPRASAVARDEPSHPAAPAVPLRRPTSPLVRPARAASSNGAREGSPEEGELSDADSDGAGPGPAPRSRSRDGSELRRHAEPSGWERREPSTLAEYDERSGDAGSQPRKSRKRGGARRKRRQSPVLPADRDGGWPSRQPERDSFSEQRSAERAPANRWPARSASPGPSRLDPPASADRDARMADRTEVLPAEAEPRSSPVPSAPQAESSRAPFEKHDEAAHVAPPPQDPPAREVPAEPRPAEFLEPRSESAVPRWPRRESAGADSREASESPAVRTPTPVRPEPPQPRSPPRSQYVPPPRADVQPLEPRASFVPPPRSELPPVEPRQAFVPPPRPEVPPLQPRASLVPPARADIAPRPPFSPVTAVRSPLSATATPPRGPGAMSPPNSAASGSTPPTGPRQMSRPAAQQPPPSAPTGPRAQFAAARFGAPAPPKQPSAMRTPSGPRAFMRVEQPAASPPKPGAPPPPPPPAALPPPPPPSPPPPPPPPAEEDDVSVPPPPPPPGSPPPPPAEVEEPAPASPPPPTLSFGHVLLPHELPLEPSSSQRGFKTVYDPNLDRGSAKGKEAVRRYQTQEDMAAVSVDPRKSLPPVKHGRGAVRTQLAYPVWEVSVSRGAGPGEGGGALPMESVCGGAVRAGLDVGLGVLLTRCASAVGWQLGGPATAAASSVAARDGPIASHAARPGRQFLHGVWAHPRDGAQDGPAYEPEPGHLPHRVCARLRRGRQADAVAQPAARRRGGTQGHDAEQRTAHHERRHHRRARRPRALEVRACVPRAAGQALPATHGEAARERHAERAESGLARWRRQCHLSEWPARRSGIWQRLADGAAYRSARPAQSAADGPGRQHAARPTWADVRARLRVACDCVTHGPHAAEQRPRLFVASLAGRREGLRPRASRRRRHGSRLGQRGRLPPEATGRLLRQTRAWRAWRAWRTDWPAQWHAAIAGRPRRCGCVQRSCSTGDDCRGGRARHDHGQAGGHAASRRPEVPVRRRTARAGRQRAEATHALRRLWRVRGAQRLVGLVCHLRHGRWRTALPHGARQEEGHERQHPDLDRGADALHPRRDAHRHDVGAEGGRRGHLHASSCRAGRCRRALRCRRLSWRPWRARRAHLQRRGWPSCASCCAARQRLGPRARPRPQCGRAAGAVGR